MSASSPSPSFSPSLVPAPLATPQFSVPLAPQQSKPNNNADAPPPLPSAASSPPRQSPPLPSATSPPPLQSPPPASASPPPSQSPPPAATSPPPPSLPTPPPSPPSAPPPASPPPLPPPVLSPPPPVPASPPVSASPPPPTSSFPPPPPPPSASRPLPSSPSPPPPAPRAVSPSPPNASPPTGAVPPPKSAKSPPPPPVKPPENSPPPTDLLSPAPSGSRLAPPPSPNSPQIQSLPPPRNQPQPVPTPTPAPPSNSSTIGTPPAPPLPSPVSPGLGNATQLTPAPSKPTNNTTDTVTVGNESSSKDDGIPTAAAIAIGTGAGFVVLCVVGLALWFFSRRKKKVAGYGGGNHMLPTSVSSPYNSANGRQPPFYESLYSKDPSSAPLVGDVLGGNQIPYSPTDPDGLGHSRSWFTSDELSEATDGFSERNLLGEGGFGSVYKGRLPDGREVAVKQLKVGGGQGEREFRAEVEIISRVHHRHLVSLVGYCISDNQRFLVYEYVPNNTLHYHLHGEGRPVLDWATRRKVAAGAARGIAYLHEDCHPRIIHRDIKSSNILLDNNFDSKVSDFGLAKFALDSFTHVTTRVMGTFGYLAPEYASSGKLTEKSDVFSFGVVLLELITGRKPVDASQPLGDESLVEWARPLLSHALDDGGCEGLADPRLEKNYVENEMLQMIEAAAACVRHSAAKRPRMSQVVRALDGISDSGDLSNGLTPGQSEFFVSAQSAEIRLFHRMAFGSQDLSTDVSQNSWRTEREL